MKKLLPLILIPFAFLNLYGQEGDLGGARSGNTSPFQIFLNLNTIDPNFALNKVEMAKIDPEKTFSPSNFCSHESTTFSRFHKTFELFTSPFHQIRYAQQAQTIQKRKSKEDKNVNLYFDEVNNSIVSKPFLRLSHSTANDFLTIQYPKQLGILNIFNMQNKLIYSIKTDESGEAKIDVSALEAGTYILFFSNGREFQTAKFVKIL